VPPITRERFEGCVVGLAVGDALGYPAEFRSRQKILAAFGEAGLTGFVAVHDPRWPPAPMILGPRHPPGTFSDDTQMSVAVAEALLEAGRDDLDRLMAAMARRFIEWSRSPDNNRAPGSACLTGCRSLEQGRPWREAGVADSKGCGSAMRTAPIGLYWHSDPPRLLKVARASALLTHRHDAGVEGAAATALLVKLALEGAGPEHMHARVLAECGPRSADFNACFEKLPRLIEAPPELALSRRGLGEGWVAEEAVASALYCHWRHPGDFAACVLCAANTDGDSDSIACIAGGISGAAHGLAAIPREWQAGVEGGPELRHLAGRLWEAAPQ
jgi:ADP-ribosylglycohydrolase